MDPEIEQRFRKTDKTLEEHLANAYVYIDELRASHIEHAERMRMLEARQDKFDEAINKLDSGLLRLIEIQNKTADILAAMNGKWNNHENRLNAGGL